MTELKEGMRVPYDVVIKNIEGSEVVEYTTESIFKGNKVVVFSLPGAFTPTCSSTHVPRYEHLSNHFYNLGVDEIVCVSVNDMFVMDAWKQDQQSYNIDFMPDGNGEFTEKMGMLVDKSDLGFGNRSWRYSMYVEDGIIKKMFVEPEVEGDPFEVSDADTMLSYLKELKGDTTDFPSDVLIITRSGCPYCERAKEILIETCYDFNELEVNRDIAETGLRAVSGKSTVPQIFIDSKYIGGLDELETLFNN